MALAERVRVVVIGGGVIGTSVAYHLTRLGWTDLVLLEQGQLSCGTTWHAAGLVGQLRASQSGTRMVQYSCELYQGLEAEVGLSTGYKRCGGVTVARTPQRMTQLLRTAATAEAFGLECEVISAVRAQELYPLLRADDLLGGLWLPGDGTANPTDLTAALARGARQGGAQVVERARVIDVLTDGRRVTGVLVEHGGDQHRIEADVVVNCAGQWAKAVGALGGVTVPLHSAEHFYVVTEQFDGVRRDLPVLRDPDGYTYFKEEVGGLVVGGFEPQAKPWVAPDRLPHPFEFQLLAEDWDHFSVLMDSAVHRIPALGQVGVKKFYNGPESFTPDNQFILGEAPELDNFYVAAGFNSVGIASAGGAGRALAEWIVEGAPTSDLTLVDIRRFASFNGNNSWLHDRVGEVLGLHYAVPWPNRELDSARPFRRSPVHAQLAARGAVFGSKMGWERPNFFTASGTADGRERDVPDGRERDATPSIVYGWGRQNWHETCVAEQRATRERVAIYDQTSFGKLLVIGAQASSALQWICAGDVDVPVGRTVYTAMLNPRGGFEADVTLTRLSDDEYLLITGAGSVVRDADHLRRHWPSGARPAVVDVSSAYAVFGVMGPQSRALLQRVSRSDLSATGFPFGSSREIDLGYCTVRATRITYVGELGWELYVPSEFAVGVFETLTEAGTEFGLAQAGYYAMNALRLDKGYRAFGSDLTPVDTPLEAGLSFATKLSGPLDFIGRSALEKQKVNGVSRRLMSFTVGLDDDPELAVWGGELLRRDGVAVGQVSSAAWSAAVNGALGLVWVSQPGGGALDPRTLSEGEFTLDVGGVLRPVTLSRRAPFDPEGLRIHA
ncbi:FAD-dependent oxidoreductase [Jatrophihabitans telluris]|uniref:FAD-dependent oxidoreductase n=1 Tax=Jatrophihabitans telluris TaxID=2038343 RepID=A0ABY4QW16_9ACTN|nr:FAD-dependent oxidoreductase [Jatrophihabitans telluris]UQX87322.1 FAD-dependent oxidoreductase [Jatrophihabitans telluris]